METENQVANVLKRDAYKFSNSARMRYLL